MHRFEALAKEDPAIHELLMAELNRQRDQIVLIASENFASEAVMETMGSYFTNKYAEGYPSKRYYGGCIHVDAIENLAIERAKELFGADHVNVQPHSGAQANTAVYLALLQKDDCVLGMNLAHGGHLTHGSPVNISGKYYNFQSYGVEEETETINYDEVLKIARELKPKLIVCGASSYPRALDFAQFRRIADDVGAYLMADIAHIAGLVAAGLHQSPVPYADIVTTTTHKTLRGPRGGMIMCREELAKKIDSAVFPGAQGGPHMHVIAAKAVSFEEALKEDFRDYQKKVVDNAKTLAQTLETGGIRLVSGGTDTHMVLIDVSHSGRTGRDVEKQLEAAHIATNKNAIPFDKEKPFVAGGIRLGTPAATTRGLGQPQMEKLGRIIAQVIRSGDAAVPEAAAEVEMILREFPLYA